MFQAEESSDVESRSKVRLVVPNSSCGGIIGKGGSTIKYAYYISVFVLFTSKNLLSLIALLTLRRLKLKIDFFFGLAFKCCWVN